MGEDWQPKHFPEKPKLGRRRTLPRAEPAALRFQGASDTIPEKQSSLSLRTIDLPKHSSLSLWQAALSLEAVGDREGSSEDWGVPAGGQASTTSPAEDRAAVRGEVRVQVQPLGRRGTGLHAGAGLGLTRCHPGRLGR